MNIINGIYGYIPVFVSNVITYFTYYWVLEQVGLYIKNTILYKTKNKEFVS